MLLLERSAGLVAFMRRILVVILFGVGLCVILLEMGLRLWLTPRVATLPHPLYLLSRIPGSTGSWTSPDGEFRQVIHFNSLGLRGCEPRWGPTPRYLILGDSMIEALQVTEEETLCDRLQQGLGAGGVVVNAGVGGYSPLLMRLRLPGLLDKVHPRMVIAGVFPNDLEEEYRYWNMATLDGNGVPVAVVNPVFSSWTGRLEVALFQTSILWRSLHFPKPLATPEGLFRRNGEPSEEVLYPFREYWTMAEEEAWGKISRSIGEMERLCHAQAAIFHLVLIPPGNQVSPNAWKTGKQVMGFGPEDWIANSTFQQEALARARRIGVSVTDLLPPFRLHPDPAKLYFDRDGHWTAEGHQLAAQVLLQDASIAWVAP